MDLFKKLCYLLVIISPILAWEWDANSYLLSDSDLEFTSELNPNLYYLGKQLITSFVTNPLRLNDTNELQDTKTLEYITEMGEVENYHLEETRCSDFVLNYNAINDVRFQLYNKVYPFGVDISKDFKEDLLIESAPIKFIIHGFLDGENFEMAQTVKNAYLLRPENYNIIVVDWTKGSGSWISKEFTCLISRRIVLKVGETIANFITNMMHQNVNILYVNLVGHGLGAHIAGITGKSLMMKGYKIPIIVGLDPAPPIFQQLSEKLSAKDAEYVEVIHTNGLRFDFMNVPFAGTADYCVNYGQLLNLMPGCWTASCSHAMAFKYFAESIKSPTAFKALKCDSLEEMQEMLCKEGTFYMGGNDMRIGKAAGIFRVVTNKKAPYQSIKINLH